MHILGAIAEFERARIAERVKPDLQRARAQGKRLGRPRKVRPAIGIPGRSVRAAAQVYGWTRTSDQRRGVRRHGGGWPVDIGFQQRTVRW